MKKVLCTVFAVGMAALVTNQNAQALPINGGTIDVGDLDDFVAGAKLKNSGTATELNWVNSVLGTDYSGLEKIEFSDDYSGWIAVDGVANIYAYLLPTPANYFMIKTGKSKNTSDTHFLYNNVSSYNYAVIDLSAFGDGFTLENIEKISHISLFGEHEQPEDPPNAVPEPATMLLFGAGMMGLAAVSRRRLQ